MSEERQKAIIHTCLTEQWWPPRIDVGADIIFGEEIPLLSLVLSTASISKLHNPNGLL